MKLNLGCGRDIREGWVNIDRCPGPGVLVHDLREPLPFPDDSAEYILAADVLEHILEWEKVVKDCHRVLRPGGLLEVCVPFGFAPILYHVRFFDHRTMDGFLIGDHETDSLEEESLFKLMSRKIVRRYPGQWHVRKYLGRDIPFIGLRSQVIWKMQKVVTEGEHDR